MQRFHLAFTTIPLILSRLFPRERFGYPEKVTFYDRGYMSLFDVVPNNDDGEYFLVLLKRDDFIMGYQAVEGFVCPKHAFKVMLEQEVRSDVIMVGASDIYQ